MNNKFKFWCPAEIKKAKDKDGVEVFRIGGIASTADEDSDGEFLDPAGFDIEEFKKSGLVNWHHQAKNAPASIIGEPSLAELRKDGFYVETDLYPNDMGKQVADLAETLNKYSKTRKLGYSIEGTVVERGSDDKTHPDYKKIKKAVITGLAITHMPKNSKTFADIIKGHVDEDNDLNGLDSPEIISKVTKKSKYIFKAMSSAEQYFTIIDTYTGINILKAEKVNNFLNQIKTDMSKIGKISDEQIEKAFNALGLDSNENPFIEKIEKGKKDEEEEEMTDDKTTAKTSKKKPDTMEKGEDDEEEEDDKTVKKGKTSEEEKPVVEVIEKGIDSPILTAISALASKQDRDAKNLGTLVKAQMDTIGELSTKLDKTETALEKANSAIEALSEQPNQRKSVTKFSDKQFEKGEDTSVKGNNVLSKSRDANKILSILDSATFAKGNYDNEYGNAVTSFESTKTLTANVINRLKLEAGITITE